VSDRVFSGRDVQDALDQAAQALGQSRERLRYVVLEAGTPGGLGLKPTPARVAVLLTGGPAALDRTPARQERPAAPHATGEDDREEGAADPGAEIGLLVAALAQTAGLDLGADVEAQPEALLVHFHGRDAGPFLLAGEDPSVLEALEHLLHGMFAHRIAPKRLRVECAGRKEQREERLRETALGLAREVLSDGQPRTTGPLNSYERRLVHVAVAELRGLVTYSVGGGADRRVTIAPAEAPGGGEVH
jgi:spoIIIJ-associated protein